MVNLVFGISIDSDPWSSTSRNSTATLAFLMSPWDELLWISWCSDFNLIQLALLPNTNSKLSIRFDLPEPYTYTIIQTIGSNDGCELPMEGSYFESSVVTFKVLHDNLVDDEAPGLIFYVHFKFKIRILELIFTLIGGLRRCQIWI